MRSAAQIPLLLCLLSACPKTGGGRGAPTSDSVLADWARSQLDLRAWRSCARSALDIDLETAEITFAIDPTGKVGTVTLLPAAQAHDPGMICLAMELAHPPEIVPTSGEAHVVRMVAGEVHETPGPGT